MLFCLNVLRSILTRIWEKGLEFDVADCLKALSNAIVELDADRQRDGSVAEWRSGSVLGS